MSKYKKERIYIPPGPTVVWKKQENGKLASQVVKRRGYYREQKVKK